MLLLNKKIVSFLIGILLIISSCSISPEKNEENNSVSNNSGSVNVILPSRFNFGLPLEKNNNSSRAYVFAEKVVVTFTPLEGTSYVDTFNENLVSGGNNDTISHEMALEAGTYTATVEVFNNSESTEIPVLRGEATDVVVVKGKEQNLNIVLEPVNPTVITFGTQVDVGEIEATTAEALGSDYDELTFTYELGGEKWYKFTAQGDYTKLDFVRDELNKYESFAIFDKAGNRTTFFDDIIYKTETGEEYFIVAAKMILGENFLRLSAIDQGTSFNRSFTLSTVTLTADTNNDSSNPVSLTLGEPFPIEFNGEFDSDYFTVDLDANKTYVITLPNNLNAKLDVDGFTLTTEVYGDTIYYTPDFDETVILDIDFLSYFSSPGLEVDLVIAEANTLPIEFQVLDKTVGEYYIPETIKSIDVQLIRYVDGQRSVIASHSMHIDDSSSNNNVDFGIIKNWDNAFIVFGYKDANGNYVGGRTNTISYYLELGGLVYLNQDYLNVYDNSIETFLTQDAVVDFNYNYRNGSQYILDKVSDLDIAFSFESKPAGSQLTDADIIKTEYGFFAFTPDVEGEYIVKGTFKDLILEDNATYTINVVGDNQGGVYVDFE